jgi:hypothetical protein
MRPPAVAAPDFSNAERVEVDKAGRILIPQSLREAAQLESEAVLVGVLKPLRNLVAFVVESSKRKHDQAEANEQRFSALACRYAMSTAGGGTTRTFQYFTRKLYML